LPPAELLPALPREGEGRWLPGLLGALTSVFLMQSGLLSILFMAPLGFLGCFFGRRTAWMGAFLAALFNTLCTLGLSLFVGRDFALSLPGLGYFFLMLGAFTWLVAPPLTGPGIFRIRAAYRLIAGALVGALAGMGLMSEDAGLVSMMRSQAELLSSMFVASAEADAVRYSLLEQELSPERIMQVFNMVQARGGSLGAFMLVFFINRQLSLGLAALIRRWRGGRVGDTSLMAFHVPAGLVWVFSLFLGGILAFRILGLSLPETVAWNGFTLCTLMYLAQGWGIVRFFVSRRPAGRLLLNIGIVLVAFSPGINVVALGLLMLLGIAEHWAPFRVVRNRPPSTPTA
jgi:hypothetical protein